MKLHLYHCDICGKLIAVLPGTEVPTYCCGQPMEELIPNNTDGAYEKHVPVFMKDGSTVPVRVGSLPHPMTDSHYITWIGLRTASGFQFRELHPGDKPDTVFYIHPGDRVEAVYSFCNLHGLWYSDREV